MPTQLFKAMPQRSCPRVTTAIKSFDGNEYNEECLSVVVDDVVDILPTPPDNAGCLDITMSLRDMAGILQKMSNK